MFAIITVECRVSWEGQDGLSKIPGGAAGGSKVYLVVLKIEHC
jgi:hypothetical protein